MTGAAELAHAAGGLLVAGSDPVAAGLLRPVGELGADVAVGEGQPLGTPLAFGGPYVGLFAVKQAPYVRRWLPGALGRWDWLTAPVRAERLAALRVGVGLVLLFDILYSYLPFLRDYYGPGSLGDPDVFASRFEWPSWHWSVLRWLPADVRARYPELIDVTPVPSARSIR